MKQARNLLLAGVVLAVLGYLSAYGYMYSKVKSGVDKIALGLMMAGQFQYDGISVSPLSSSFSIDDIRFTPHGFNDPLKIEAVQVHVENLLDLMELSDGMSMRAELPGKARIAAVGLDIPFQTDWFRQGMDAVLHSLSQVDYTPVLCGGTWPIGPTQWEEMGYERLVTDVSVSIHHDTYLARMDNVIDITLRDMGRVRYEVSTSAPEDSSLLSFAQMQKPRIKEIQMSYTDLSYVKRETAYCAKRSNMTVSEYAEARANQSERDYIMSWGMVPGDDIRQAHARFLRNPGAIVAVMRPSESFNIRTLHLYNPKDMPAVLRLRVKVNGEAVNDLSFRTPEEVNLDDQVVSASPYSLRAGLGKLGNALRTQEEEPAPVQKATAPKKEEEPHYRRVKLDQIAEHIGQPVKVYVGGGLVRRGVLERVQDSKLFVVRNVHGGKFTVPVPYAKVAKVEVFY